MSNNALRFGRQRDQGNTTVNLSSGEIVNNRDRLTSDWAGCYWGCISLALGSLGNLYMHDVMQT